MAGKPLGPLHGLPFSIKDLRVHQGRAHDGRLAHLRHARARRRRAVRAPAAARRAAIMRGQDDHARVRLEGARRQPAHRHHAQSLEHRDDDGRLQRGRRRGRRRRAGTAPPGLGRRRLDPHPVGVLRLFGLKPTYGRVPHVAGLQQRLRHARRADDAHGGRRRADAERDGRARRLGRTSLDAPPADYVGKLDAGRARAAHRLQSRSRHAAGRSRGRERGGRRRAGLRGAGRQGGRGQDRLRGLAAR